MEKRRSLGGAAKPGRGERAAVVGGVTITAAALVFADDQAEAMHTAVAKQRRCVASRALRTTAEQRVPGCEVDVLGRPLIGILVFDLVPQRVAGVAGVDIGGQRGECSHAGRLVGEGATEMRAIDSNVLDVRKRCRGISQLAAEMIGEKVGQRCGGRGPAESL